jgi:multisubunit Na+/H+ antiporter MnhF subunit
VVNLTTISPDFIFGVIIPLLVIAMALAFVRLYRGPHLLDRVIALDH